MFGKYKYSFILILTMFISMFLHSDHFNEDFHGEHAWRQTQTMWNVRGFARDDANIFNPRVPSFKDGRQVILRYEFPLMQWGIAMVQRGFGEHIFLVRALVFAIGICSVFFIYGLLKVIGFSEVVALVGAIFFQFSPLFYHFTINPIPDNLALLGSLVYLLYIFKYIKNPNLKYLLLASLGLLVGTLAKLPFLMVSIVSVIYFFRFLFYQEKPNNDIIKFVFVQLIVVLPALLWYIWVIPSWSGNGILTGVFDNHISLTKTLEIVGYHFSTMFPIKLLNPATILFFVFGIRVLLQRKAKLNIPVIYLWGLIFVSFLYLILEFNMIGTIHDYYMMPFLPWLFIVVTIGIQWFYNKNYRKGNLLIISFIGIAMFLGFWINKDNWSLAITKFNHDVIIHKEQLKNVVGQDEQCIILNDHTNYIFSYFIDKKGYIFRNDNLHLAWIVDLIENKGVKYMYSDSRKIDEDPNLSPYIDKVLLTVGSVKVFKLKSD